MNTDSSFSSWLRERMDKQQLTPGKLSLAMGGRPTRQAIQMWLEGGMYPSRRWWGPLAAALNVAPSTVAKAVGGGA